MKKLIILIPVFIVLMMLLVSCSGNGEAVLAPDTVESGMAETVGGNTALMGFWQVVVDTQNETIEAVDMRSSGLILNVLSFMEPPPLSSMTIDFGTLDIIDPFIGVDVILSHPIPDPVFKGFDVRGVVFGPRVNNADGYTDVINPEFFAGVPFGYMDGLLGVPDSVANYNGLAGYKYFADGIGLVDNIQAFFSFEDNLADRGVFSQAPTEHSRHYLLDWTDTGQPFFTFNYAIYANYDWPVGDPGTEGVDAWVITTANSAEAFACKVTELANSLYYSGSGGGGAISLELEVWDWQGNINDVTVESWDSGIIAQASYDSTSAGTTSKSTIFEFDDMAGTPTAAGDLDILITVTDDATFGEAWFMGLLPASNTKYGDPIYNCFVHTATVSDCPMPTCTSTDPESGVGDVGTVVFTCTSLVDGPSLGVRMTDGTDDYVGTAVVFNSATEMEADIDLTGATIGETLDIVITNGCGTEGEGPATFDVFFSVHSVGGPYTTGYAARDIWCNPSADQIGMNTNASSPQWRRYNNSTYSSFTTLSFTYGIGYGFVDAQDNHVLSCLNNYGSNPPRFNAFSYATWSGTLSGYSYPTSGNHVGLKDIANLQGSLKHIWALYDESNYSRFRWCLSTGPQSMTYYTPGGSFYGGSGTTGVIPGDVRAMDMAVYPGSGDFYAYILENGTGNVSIEKWVVPGTTYESSIGGSELDNPIDLSVDSDDYIYVLNDSLTGDPEIWMYDSDGNIVGSSGPISSSVMPGTPLRLDVHLYSDPDEVHVLWQWGVTRFSAY